MVVAIRAPGGQHNPGGSALVEYAIEVAEPRDPMVMVLNTARLIALMRGEPLEERVQAAA